MLLVMLLQKFQKVEGVQGLEGAVFEGFKAGAVGFLVIFDKIIGRTIHELDQALATVDDGGAPSPGQHGHPETNDLNVLGQAELVGQADGIIWNKARLVVPSDLLVEPSADLLRKWKIRHKYNALGHAVENLLHIFVVFKAFDQTL